VEYVPVICRVGFFAFGTVTINLAAHPNRMKQDAETVTDKATKLPGGVTDDVKADGQARRHREVLIFREHNEAFR